MPTLTARPTARRGDLMVNTAMSIAMAAALPMIPFGLGLLDSVHVGTVPTLVCALGMAGLYVPALARAIARTRDAWRAQDRGGLANATILPISMLAGVVSPHAMILEPYALGISAGLRLYEAGF